MKINILKLISMAAAFTFLSATFCISSEAKPTYEELELENKALKKKVETFKKGTKTTPAPVKSSAAAASSSDETFHGALINGKISGEAKIWYQTNDSDAGKHIFDTENTYFDAGLRLTYKTASYKGFKAKVSFYAVDDLGAYENWGNHTMVRGETGHESVMTYLGEAYLSYQLGNTHAKIGRMNIKSPLVNSDDWMIFPNNFEAIMIKNTDIADTVITAGFITKERTRNDEEFDDFCDQGVAMLGIVNKSIPNTTLNGYIYNTGETTAFKFGNTATYLEASTKIGMINLATQHIMIRPHTTDFESTNAFGAKISAKINKIELGAAYSYVTDGYWGAARISDDQTKSPLFTASISGDGDISGRPDTESFSIWASTKVLDDLSVMAKYAYYSMDEADAYRNTAVANDGDATTTELCVKYTGIEHITIFSGIWYTDHEGIGAYNGKTIAGGTSKEDLITFRFWAKYVF